MLKFQQELCYYLEEVRNGTHIKERKDPEKINVFLCMCFYVFVLKAEESSVFVYNLLKEEESGENLKH